MARGLKAKKQNNPVAATATALPNLIKYSPVRNWAFAIVAGSIANSIRGVAPAGGFHRRFEIMSEPKATMA
jgi:hypothetical protein